MSSKDLKNQDCEIVVTEMTDSHQVTSHIRKRSDIPSEVKPTEGNGLPRGVETHALYLAREFMGSQGQLARKCHRRGELSHLYVSTFPTWAPGDSKNDKSLQRPFKQILFALAHGMKLVRVVNGGRKLLWNKYRDNTGDKIEILDNCEKPRRRDDRNQPRHRDDRDQYRHRDDRDQYRHRDDRDQSPPRNRYEVREEDSCGSSSDRSDSTCGQEPGNVGYDC